MQNDMRDRLVKLLDGFTDTHYCWTDDELADHLIANGVVPVVRCKDCKYSREFDKHCEINRNAYRHCALWRGEETINVWHKYTKHWNDYSIIEPDDYCSYGERKDAE